MRTWSRQTCPKGQPLEGGPSPSSGCARRPRRTRRLGVYTRLDNPLEAEIVLAELKAVEGYEHRWGSHFLLGARPQAFKPAHELRVVAGYLPSRIRGRTRRAWIAAASSPKPRVKSFPWRPTASVRSRARSSTRLSLYVVDHLIARKLRTCLRFEGQSAIRHPRVEGGPHHGPSLGEGVPQVRVRPPSVRATRPRACPALA